MCADQAGLEQHFGRTVFQVRRDSMSIGRTISRPVDFEFTISRRAVRTVRRNLDVFCFRHIPDLDAGLTVRGQVRRQLSPLRNEVRIVRTLLTNRITAAIAFFHTFAVLELVTGITSLGNARTVAAAIGVTCFSPAAIVNATCDRSVRITDTHSPEPVGFSGVVCLIDRANPEIFRSGAEVLIGLRRRTSRIS